MNTYQKNGQVGFTLMELLVVIAIIGILASVVLASVNNARDKGINAQIKSGVLSIRSQAEIYFDDSDNVYEVDDTTDSICVNGNSSTPRGAADLVTDTDAINLTGAIDCNDDPSSWALAVQLIGTDSGNYYCVDSSGFAGELVGTVGTEFAVDAVVCP